MTRRRHAAHGPRSIRPRIVVHRAVDQQYPRSQRIIADLRRRGADVEMVPPSTTGGVLRQALVDAVRLVRATRRGDVLLLAEMQLKFTPVTAAVARIRGARLVVDGFIGLHETHVEDWQVTAPGSPRALRYRLQDAFARRVADVYLVDTDVRATAVRRTAPRTTVATLPVGAPRWAAHTPPRTAAEPLRVLYYGNYIPLHGVPVIVRALGRAVSRRDVVATFIGAGAARPATERAVVDAGLQDRVRFVDPVSTDLLATEIARHDVVLGVFGTSSKAASVIPNKVWQGLASGRVVITRRSTALAEIRDLVGARLVEVPAGDPVRLAEAIETVHPKPDEVPVDDRLEAYVERRFDEFWVRLTN